MRIVSQSVSASHTHFPAPQPLMLCAPRIAGLLPARVPTAPPITPAITVTKPRESLLDRQRARWAAQDAEIEAFLVGARQRIRAACADAMPSLAEIAERAAFTGSFIWEIML